MASRTGLTSSHSSASARRHHYHTSNTTHSLNRSFSPGDASNLNDSLSLAISKSPVVIIIFSNPSSLEGMLYNKYFEFNDLICRYACQGQIHLLML